MKLRDFTFRIKYFFSSNWGKIFISFFLIAAIFLSIILPIAFLGEGKAKAIYVFGFDANFTGTGTNFDNYIGVDKDYKYWNDDIVWAQNQEQMLNGIEQSKDSIGYLGKSVSFFDVYDPILNPSGNLKALELYTNDTNLEDDILTPGYVSYDSDAYPMLASLNIWFRVPASVAPIINNNIMFSNTTGIDIDNTIWGTNWIIGSPSRTLTEEQQEYFTDYVINPGYLKYFVFSFIFFNWIAFSEDAQIIIDSVSKHYQPYDDLYLLSAQEFEEYLLNFTINLESINSNWTIDNFVNNNSDGKDVNLILTLEGSGTVQPTLNALSIGNENYDGFSFYLSSWLQDYYDDPEWTFELTLTLNNHDSGQAFAIKDNGASANAFLGTQSRGYNLDDITREERINTGENVTWGYDQITEDDLDLNGFYYLPDTQTTTDFTQPLYYTLATDPVLVLTEKNTSFKVDGNTYHPKGISSEGLKYIYSFDGRSWEWLYAMNENLIQGSLIEVEEN